MIQLKLKLESQNIKILKKPMHVSFLENIQFRPDEETSNNIINLYFFLKNLSFRFKKIIFKNQKSQNYTYKKYYLKIEHLNDYLIEEIGKQKKIKI